MPLPTIPIPLQAEDADVIISLQQTLDQVYDESRYDRLIDYSADVPAPPPGEDHSAWIREQIGR